ncbi:tRNA lysidine(34) synthetase TilS [Jeotgalibacillus marinus]|uniref:tRNA(Ile)-lysidine synthase n=1 Tax=Jeotgalibacillus marinus TaxID=86667 RepID=A0ABV3Q7Z8_9BACL
MDHFESIIRSYCDQHSLFEYGEKVIVAVSGGPDSMAILHYLLNETQFGLQVEVAHLNHMLRGEESAEDLRYVQTFCDKHSVRCHVASIDVKERMRKARKGLQETAREVRYEFLVDVMTRAQASKLVLGHHADDQIETVLFRLIRGSTGKGRAGIQPKRPFGNSFIVRPLLALTKEEIEQYCERHHIIPRQDPSNAKDDYTRNRLRHHVIPLLKEENPSLHQHIVRYNKEVTEDEAWLEKEAGRRLEALTIAHSDQFFKLDQQMFCNEAPPLQRRMIHLILNYLYTKVPTSLSAAHTVAITKLFGQPHPSGELHLPQGLIVSRSYSTVTFYFVQKNEPASPYKIELEIGQMYTLYNGVKMRLVEGVKGPPDSSIDCCWIDLSQVELPLIVRNRRDGDRIQLKGMSGSKKIKDVFMEAKIPLHLRVQWPIVTDASGKVLWIPGIRTAHGVDKPLKGNRAFTLIYYKDLLGGHSLC